MRIAILGTRGIPNNYGGFEQFAEYLSEGLVSAGHEVFVYTTHDHPYKQKTYKGVNLIHIYNPEVRIGTWGQFVYDLLSIYDSRKRKFDLIYQLGYTSSSIWGTLLPSKAIICTNMDGLEWKRSKYRPVVQRFLRKAEKWAVNTSDVLIADSLGIKHYLKEKYQIASHYFPYGTYLFEQPDVSIINKKGFDAFGYNMLIARMEPENNIDTILAGVVASKNQLRFLVIGNYKNGYGDYLYQKYATDKRIVFLGPEYDIQLLNNLRYFSNLYFHGHSVGGTNPSLLEAMGSQALICAHNNEFNASILGNEAYYFDSADDVCKRLDAVISADSRSAFIAANCEKINQLYLWPKIVGDYEQFFRSLKK